MASKWLDMVVGLDLHMELVPMPAPTPTPFPHPFIGLIFDPAGMILEEVIAAVAAWLTDAPPDPGKVWISGSPATVTGDAVSMPVPHIIIPPGLSWVPMPRAPAPKIGLRGKLPLPAPPVPPPSDAVLMMGAQFVKIQGANAVRSGEIALSCSDPVRMPTSQVVSTGMSGLVTVGGPPGVDWQQVTLMAGMRTLRTDWLADRVLNAAGKAIPEVFKRARNIVHKSACVLTGHPVNVATGSVLTDAVDFELAGQIPLTFERNYNSTWFDRASTLGHGWVHSLDQRMWIESHCIAYQTPDGREIEFSTRALEGGVMRKGDTLFDPVDRLTLRSHGQFRWTLRRPDGVVLEFSPIAGESGQDTDRGLARLSKVRSPQGHAVGFEYDNKAQLLRATTSGGRAATFEHDPRGRLRRIGLPAADGSGVRPHAEFRYDDNGDLVEVIDALGQLTRYRYDRHLLVAETDRNGLSFFFKYDGYGRFARCVETWGIDPARGADAGIYHHLINHDRTNRRTVVTDSLQRVAVYEYDGAFMVTKKVNALGAESSFAYDRAHHQVEHVDALGRVTETTYDERGNRTMVAAPGQRVTKFEYDAEDRCIAKTNAAGARWMWSYDAFGRVVSQTDPIGYVERYTYEPGGLSGIVDAAGYATRIVRNDAGDVISVTTADGAVQHWDRDSLGDVVGFVDALGQRTRLSRDALGRVVQVDAPDGNVRQFGYDREGNLVRVRDRGADVVMSYCGLGRLASRTIGEAPTVFTYDTEDQLIAVTNAAGHSYRYQLSPLGEVDAEIAFDGRETRYERDALGRVITVTGGDGVSTRIEYNDAGHVVSVARDGGATIRYVHRKDGALLEAATEDAPLSFERDALGRATREACGDDWITSAYDHAGRRTVLESSRDAKVECTFGPGGSLSRLAATFQGTQWDATFSRNALGQEVDHQVPGNARSYWWRDELGRPTQHFIGVDQAPLRLRKYAWDPGDRLRQLEESEQEPTVFEHDARGVLSKIIGPAGEIGLRSVDAAGNLVLHADGGREYDDAGALLQRRTADGGICRYAYDARGNLKHRTDEDGGQWFFHHDGAEQLTQVDRPDGAAVSFSYDALGRRIAKNANGVVTRWLWDGLRPLHEWREAGDPPPLIRTRELAARRAGLLELRKTLQAKLGDPGEAQWWSRLRTDALTDFIAAEVLREAEGEQDDRFDPGPDRGPLVWVFGVDPFAPLARLAAAGAHSIMTDHLGAPLCLLAAEPNPEQPAWQCTLDVMGAASVSGDAHLCPWRFPGQYSDVETGLFYNRFRYYDPARGDYLEVDPLGLEGGMNLHAYVDDPTTRVDPLGLSASGGCAPPGFGPMDETICVAGEHSYTEQWAQLRDLPSPKVSRNAVAPDLRRGTAPLGGRNGVPSTEVFTPLPERSE